MLDLPNGSSLTECAVCGPQCTTLAILFFAFLTTLAPGVEALDALATLCNLVAGMVVGAVSVKQVVALVNTSRAKRKKGGPVAGAVKQRRTSTTTNPLNNDSTRSKV